MKDVLPHRREDGFSPGKIRRLTANHERERPRFCGSNAPGHRGIQHGKPGFSRVSVSLTRVFNSDGGAVDEQSARCHGARDTACVKVNVQHVTACWQHGHNHIRARSSIFG